MVVSLLALTTPTMGPPPITCWLLELTSPCAVPGAIWEEACEESDPGAVLVPGVFEAPELLDVPEFAELLKPPPNPPFELPPNAPLEFPPNADGCDEAEPPNAEPLEPELLIDATEVAPAIIPPPMLPPSETPGSP
jgi:hypothetical protein